MGPDPSSKSSGTPSRQRFSWEQKSVPLNDGKVPQDEYVESVAYWYKVYDIIPNRNAIKLSKRRRGIVLKWKCYGRAKDSVK